MDTFSLIADERRSLADALDGLTADDWATPSLCGEWTTHQVAAHLNVPFEISTVPFLVAMAKALGNFDRANHRLAVDLAQRMDPASCIAGLRANAGSRFTPPGFGPEAPLTDTIIHGGDILQPVGGTVAVAPEALAVSLRFLATPRAAKAFGGGAKGVQLAPTDVDLELGDGPRLEGPGRSMLCALAGRSAYLDELSGPGVDVLRSRARS